MPLDSVCEPVAAFPKELNEDLTVGWLSVIPGCHASGRRTISISCLNL
jgi:hypothetical protein